MSNSDLPDSSKSDRLCQRHYEIACDLHDHIESQATLAVMKSSVLLAAHTVLGAAYIPVAGALQVFDRGVETFPEYLFLVSGILFLLAFVISLASIWPRRRSDYANRLIFYGGIAALSSAQEYEKHYCAASRDSLGSMLLAGIYGKSVWLKKTFALVQAAIICSALGTVLCVISVALLKSHDSVPVRVIFKT